MLSHVLANNPRVGYAHQSNLIGPATQNGQDYGYTLLTLINNMLCQYNTWYTTNSPLDQMTDLTSAQTLAEQGAWATASKGGQVSATVQNGVVTVTNGGSEVKVPVTVPAGTTVNGGAAFGQSYGGDRSDWVDLGNGATETLNENVGPAITSAASASSIVGTAFSFTVTTTGAPTAVPHRDRQPARRRLVQGQRRRHRDHLRHPGVRQRGQLPDSDHRRQQRRRHDPELHADQRRGTDHHQSEHGHLQHRGGGHLHGDHAPVPRSRPSPSRAPSRPG